MTDLSKIKTVIVDMGEEMKQLCKMLDNPSLPCIDKSALLDQIVETVFYKPEAETQIHDFKNQILSTDILYTGPGEVAQGLEELTKQIGIAATELVGQISRYGLSQDNYFNYQFSRNIHDQTIIFSRKER